MCACARACVCAPQLSARSRTNENKRLGSAIPRSRRSHGTTSAKSLSPVSKKKPQRASDTSFLDRLAAKSRSKARPRTAGPVTCSASGKWSRPGGGRFSLGKPKSETDWIIKRSRETPGPGQYSPAYVRKNRAVKISNANPKSETDRIILRSSQKPGPGAYSPQNINRSKGLKISDANPKSDLDWVIHRSKQSPAPNAYQNPMKTIQQAGGKFSTAKPLTDTEILMIRSSESPGPNQYRVVLPTDGRGATKISDANPKSYLDWTIHRSKEVPGVREDYFCCNFFCFFIFGIVVFLLWLVRLMTFCRGLLGMKTRAGERYTYMPMSYVRTYVVCTYRSVLVSSNSEIGFGRVI